MKDRRGSAMTGHADTAQSRQPDCAVARDGCMGTPLRLIMPSVSVKRSMNDSLEKRQGQH